MKFYNIKNKNTKFSGGVLIKSFDIFIIILLIFSAFFLYFPKLIDKSDISAHIYMSGKLYDTISLDDVEKEYIINLPCEPEMEVCVDKGSIFVKKANCPDKLCVECGKLEKNGDIAVCVPAGVVIIIKSTKPTAVDVVAY